VFVRAPLVVCPLLFVTSDLGKIDRPLRVLGPIVVLCEMRPLYRELATCERKAKKDAPADVVSRAAFVSRDLCRLRPDDPVRLGQTYLVASRQPSFDHS